MVFSNADVPRTSRRECWQYQFYIEPDDANVAHQAVVNLVNAGRDILLRSLDGDDAGACDLAHVVVDTATATIDIWLDDRISEGYCHFHEVDLFSAGLSLFTFGNATRVSISFLIPEALRAARGLGYAGLGPIGSDSPRG